MRTLFSEKDCRPVLTLCLIPFLALGLTGCVETDDEYTLNPDGSGKVVHRSYFQSVDFSVGQPPQEEKLRAEVLKIVEKSVGVDAWTDVSYEIADDGRLFFQGTAYFPDINKLDLHGSKAKPSAIKSGGKLVIALRKGGDQPMAKNTKQASSEAEILEAIKETRADYQQSRGMLKLTLGEMKQRVHIRVPGAVEASTNFKTNGQRLSLEIDGAKLLSMIDARFKDDQWVRSMVNTGALTNDQFGIMDPSFNEVMFGTTGRVQAVIVPPFQDAFDYKAEVVKAKAEFAAIVKQFGLLQRTIVPAPGGKLKSVSIEEISATLKDPGHALSYGKPGITFSIKVEFPGAVSAANAIVTRIVDDTGADLKIRSHSSFGGNQLSVDKTSFKFDASASLPGTNAHGFKEISGKVEYQTVVGFRAIDLGFSELKEGADGQELLAKIEAFAAAPARSVGQHMDLKLRIDPENLRGLKFIDEFGREFQLTRKGYRGGKEIYTYTFTHTAGIAGKGKLIAEVFDRLERFEIPFKIEHFDLIGRPR